MESSELLETLPNESIWEVATNLAYPDLINLCRTNKQLKDLCQSEDFWTYYLNKYYFVTLIPNQVNRHSLVKKIYRFISKIWQHKSVVDFRFPQLLVDLTKEQSDDLWYSLDSRPKQALGVVMCGYEAVYDVEDNLSRLYGFTPDMFPLPPFDISKFKGKPSLSALGDEELEFIYLYVSYITKDTPYFTPQGLKNLPLDDAVEVYIETFIIREPLSGNWDISPVDEDEIMLNINRLVEEIISRDGVYIKYVYPIFRK